MPNLVVHRVSDYAHKTRNFELYLDEEPIGELADGSSSDFQLPPGKHIFHAKLDWWQSRQINFFAAGEQEVVILISAHKMTKYFLPLGIFLAILQFIMLQKYHLFPLFLVAIIGAYLGFFFYIFGLGKKHYLEIALRFKN